MSRCSSEVAKFKMLNAVRRSRSDVAKPGKKSGDGANKDERDSEGKKPVAKTRKDERKGRNAPEGLVSDALAADARP